GGLVLLIERPGLEPIAEPEHASENALAGYVFDGVIRNDGTVWGLYTSVREAMRAHDVNIELFC
ncbi:hypothetical protein ACWD0G_04240, partial [Streptomyces goshikiensis]